MGKVRIADLFAWTAE